jgi:hypothetical protein
MKKILFNNKYGLTKAVLEGRKTQTRRVLNPTMFFQRLETFEGWSKDDISAWKRSSCRLLYEAQGYELQQMLDYALSSSRYKVGEEVAVAQAYCDSVSEAGYNEAEINKLMHSKGWTNKMFVKADLMPHRIRITDIRVERLQEISDEDCIAEGIKTYPEADKYMWGFSNIKGAALALKFELSTTPREAYAKLIDHISGKGTWKSNPYVFVYEFELVK